MSIADTIQLLQTAKSDISTAITDMGGVVNAGDGFADFPADIRTIPTGSDVIPVTITAAATSSSVVLTLDKAIPVSLSAVFTIDGSATTYAIASGATSLTIPVSTSTSARTATLAVSADSYATLFSITAPSTISVPAYRVTLNFVVSDITSTGCTITASNNPMSPVTCSVTFGGNTYTGTITAVGSPTCTLTWAAPSVSTQASVSLSPQSDSVYDYALDTDTITIPAGEPTYTVLTYIEATGTQYIKTDITTAYGMTIVGKFYGVAPSSSTGAANGTNTEWLWRAGSQSNFLLYNAGSRLYGSNGSYAWYQTDSGLMSGRYIKTLIAIDGGTTSTTSRSGYIFGTDASIFNSTAFSRLTNSGWSTSPVYEGITLCCNETSAGPSACRFYGMEITEDGVVTHNLIPAMRDSDSVVGVLDSVTDTFYENAGTGTFLYA